MNVWQVLCFFPQYMNKMKKNKASHYIIDCFNFSPKIEKKKPQLTCVTDKQQMKPFLIEHLFPPTVAFSPQSESMIFACLMNNVRVCVCVFEER